MLSLTAALRRRDDLTLEETAAEGEDQAAVEARLRAQVPTTHQVAAVTAPETKPTLRVRLVAHSIETREVSADAAGGYESAKAEVLGQVDADAWQVLSWRLV